jgi:hypothetical protein
MDWDCSQGILLRMFAIDEKADEAEALEEDEELK